MAQIGNGLKQLQHQLNQFKRQAIGQAIQTDRATSVSLEAACHSAGLSYSTGNEWVQRAEGRPTCAKYSTYHPLLDRNRTNEVAPLQLQVDPEQFGAPTALKFSPDRKYIVFQRNTVGKILSLQDGRTFDLKGTHGLIDS